MLEPHTPGRFNILKAVEEALALTKRHKRKAITLVAPFALALIVIELFTMPPSLSLDGLTSLTATQQHPLLNQLLRLALAVPITAVFLLAMATFGLRRSAGERVEPAQAVRENLARLPHAIVTAALALSPDYLLNALRPGLGTLLGLPLSLTLMLSIYWVVDQELDAFRAAGQALKLTVTNFPQGLFAMVLFLASVIASVLTIGVGFLLCVPVAVVIGAAIYRQAEGLHKRYEPEPSA